MAVREGTTFASFRANTFAQTESFVIRLKGSRTRTGDWRDPVRIEYWIEVYNDSFYPVGTFVLDATSLEEALEIFKNEILLALDTKLSHRIEWWEAHG